MGLPSSSDRPLAGSISRPLMFAVMRYQIVLEHDRETGHYAATVPGLPFFVDAESEREARELVKGAISFYLDEISSERPEKASRPVSSSPVKIVTVDV